MFVKRKYFSFGDISDFQLKYLHKKLYFCANYALFGAKRDSVFEVEEIIKNFGFECKYLLGVRC